VTVSSIVVSTAGVWAALATYPETASISTKTR
jgi:hypothetical protein